MKMLRKKSKGTLADEIAGVLSSVPGQFHPDEEIDDTDAKLADFDERNDDADDEELLSKFRKQNISLLSDVDKRYAGKKGSRKKLHSESSNDSVDDFSNDESESGQNSNIEDENIDNELETESENEESEIDENNCDHSEIEGSVEMSEDESNFQHMPKMNISHQVQKGLCVRNQMNIWENLLEVRIQLQKCLLAANKMPHGNYYEELVQESTDEFNFKDKVMETKTNIGNALDKLLTLQSLVIKKYPETQKLERKDQQKNDEEEGSDEEIPSDTEEEIDENENNSETDLVINSSKRRKLNEYEETISDLHEKYKSFRNDTIEKWNTKTRLSVIKNSGQAHSVVGYIEHILTDKDKLRKRTQLKRADYKILMPKESTEERLQTNENSGDMKQVEEYNTEIFDDTDFYHQLLRELIEVKSTDITDPVQLGRQWIQLHNLRSKLKRKIDTKATKGRKIKYVVHPKLVNFMAPIDNQKWTDQAKDELFNSLFGKIQLKTV